MSQSQWPGFARTLKENSFTLNRTPLKQLQINVGKLCNQACFHCHVDAGPNKLRENMDQKTAERLVELAKGCDSIETVDLTGGAPELNPHFRYLASEFRKMGKNVIDRCNLTVLFEKGQEDTAQFLADNSISVVASLPCYSKDNVDKQRGDGVFEKSIKALQNLNELGYGRKDGLVLDLVYNPLGPTLPPPQEKLEKDYKKLLYDEFKIEFNNLFTITNMPIKRFLFDLKRSGKLEEYMQLLVSSFNLQAAENVMCRSFLSVSWDGKLYDCDFNQMLEIPVPSKNKDVWSVESLDQFSSGPIAMDDHCYGCTAGSGSSCGGSVV
jgi:radical SAM/Cys-rich protein